MNAPPTQLKVFDQHGWRPLYYDLQPRNHDPHDTTVVDKGLYRKIDKDGRPGLGGPRDTAVRDSVRDSEQPDLKDTKRKDVLRRAFLGLQKQ